MQILFSSRSPRRLLNERRKSRLTNHLTLDLMINFTTLP